jgi:hypothetical protein
MKKLKTFSIAIILLFSINNYLYSQNQNYLDFKFKISEKVSVKLPSNGDDVFYKELTSTTESIFNDNFDIELTKFDGEYYEYFPDLSKYIKEIAKGSKIKKYKDFIEKNISPAINCKFSVYYSDEEGCNIVFGVIQDGRSKVLYEFNLYCFKIDLDTAKIIINSIITNN